ncbi:MAG: roadblock/LC7 domain-containing protein [Promethearchaeota archaeon]
MLGIKKFDGVLSKIIKSETGIKKVILVDRTGLTIAHVSKFSYYPVDVDGIGAIASAVFCASEEQGKNLDIGDLQIVTSEFGNGKIFASSCGRGVLCVITDPDASIGMVRLVMKKASDDLSKMLDEFLSERPDVSVPAEDKATSIEKDELEAALRELEKF